MRIGAGEAAASRPPYAGRVFSSVTNAFFVEIFAETDCLFPEKMVFLSIYTEPSVKKEEPK